MRHLPAMFRDNADESSMTFSVTRGQPSRRWSRPGVKGSASKARSPRAENLINAVRPEKIRPRLSRLCRLRHKRSRPKKSSGQISPKSLQQVFSQAADSLERLALHRRRHRSKKVDTIIAGIVRPRREGDMTTLRMPSCTYGREAPGRSARRKAEDLQRPKQDVRSVHFRIVKQIDQNRSTPDSTRVDGVLAIRSTDFPG